MTQDRLIGPFAEAGLLALAPRITEDGDRDGIPNVLAEAVACGAPVVTTAVSGIPGLIQHQRAGLLVPPQDREAVAQAMARLRADPALGRRLAAAGRQRLERHFDRGANTDGFRALFRRLACAVVAPQDVHPLPASVPE